MIDTITCPRCTRQLALPPGSRDAELQCPGCGERFRARVAPPPVAVPVAVPVAEEPPPLPRAQRGRRVAARTPPAAAAARSSRKSRFIGGALVVGFLLVVACGLFASRPGRPQVMQRPLPGGFRADKKADAFELKALVEQPVPGVDAALDRELQQLFASLGAALRAADGPSIGTHLDVERMFADLAAQNVLPRPLGNQPKVVREMRLSMEQVLAQQAAVFNWDRSEVRHVRQQADDDVVVIARHRAANGVSIKMRWWLHRGAGGWRVYDFEDLDVAMRFSVTAASLLADGPANVLALQQPVARLREALLALVANNDVDTAERKLQEVVAVNLPRPFEATRWMATGLVKLHRNQHQEALDAFDNAARFHADMPVLDALKGTTYNRLSQWENALKHLQAYQALLGDDPDVNRELGEALRGLNRTDEARAAYRKALDEHPKDASAFVGLLRTVAPGQALPDLGQRFAQLDSPRENFDVVYDDCRQARDGASLEQLALAMRDIDAAFAPAHFALALVKAWAGQAAPAVAAFRAGLDAEPDVGKRRGQTAFFMRAMAGADFTVLAYAAAPEPRPAFQALTAELRKLYRLDELRPLVAAHARRDPADPLLPWYRGEVYVQAAEFVKAEQAFAAALANPPDAATLDAFRASRVLARYRTGKALTAYADLGPAQQAFQQLVSLAAMDGDDVLLQKLAVAHAKAHPADPELAAALVRLRLRQGVTDGATAVFRAALAQQTKPEERRRVTDDYLNAMADAGRPLDAYRAVADPVDAFPILAGALLSGRRHVELRQLLDVHRQRHADDPALAVQTAALLRAEQKWAEAAAAYAAAWPRVPDAQRPQVRGNYVYVLAKAGRALEAYEKVAPAVDTFHQLAYLLLHDKKPAELLKLIDAHWPLAGNDPELKFVEARARVLNQELDAALPSWQRACELQKNADQRRYYVEEVTRDLYRAGAGLRGFRAAPDQTVAFTTLARLLVTDKKVAELEALLNDAPRPGDPVPPAVRMLFRGELALLRGAPAEAEKLFASALADAVPAQRWQCQNGLTRARIHTGKIVVAYQETAGNARRFANLAYVCVMEKNADQLGALIAAHRAADPDDPDLPGWDVEAKLLAQDHAGAVALLTARRETLSYNPRFSGKFDGYLVRSLIKLKRHADAVREAETLDRRRGPRSRLLVILAHAAAGQVKNALADVERAPRDPYLLHDCYQDADLGPLLRSEPLRPFRARFPEPAVPESDGDDDL